MKPNVWMADRISFRVQGKNAHRFLNTAVEQGIRLDHLRWETDGFTARGAGRDLSKLEDLAQKGNWTFSVFQRKGPGIPLERLLDRPGILLGGVLFFLLLGLMSRFIWTIDFGSMDVETQNRMRSLLYDCQIYEGAWVDDSKLKTAQDTVSQQSDVFGWITLNFTDGCLFIENTDAEYQNIKQEAPMQPLYAKESGEVVAVEPESGFSLVVPGQTVEKGQLLVDVVRLDRDGNEIQQGASGRILGRVEKSYTASQPFRVQQLIVSGESEIYTEFFFLGKSWSQQNDNQTAQGLHQVEWLPLHLGRLNLPAMIRCETVWLQQEQAILYTQEQAQALALRNCRRQLYAEYPDAVIESERRVATVEGERAVCTVTYRFCANIASYEDWK